MHHELLQVIAGMRNVEDHRVATRRAAVADVTRSQRRRRGRAVRMVWLLPLGLLCLTLFITTQHADAHASGAAPHDPPPARITVAAVGVVYGGVTSQDFPVVIETSKNGRITEAVIAIRLTCTSGGGYTMPDDRVLPCRVGRRANLADTDADGIIESPVPVGVA